MEEVHVVGGIAAGLGGASPPMELEGKVRPPSEAEKNVKLIYNF